MASLTQGHESEQALGDGEGPWGPATHGVSKSQARLSDRSNNWTRSCPNSQHQRLGALLVAELLGGPGWVPKLPRGTVSLRGQSGCIGGLTTGFCSGEGRVWAELLKRGKNWRWGYTVAHGLSGLPPTPSLARGRDPARAAVQLLSCV